MFNKFFDFSLNIYFSKKVNIPKILTIEFYFFNNSLFFSINNIKKISSIFYKYKKFFFFNFLYKIFCLKISSGKTIFIKGIGLRINFVEDSINMLKLKLGYSHIIYLKYSQELFIFLFKKKIIIRCYNNILLGNFCMLLQKFRPINIFTGKGLHIKRNKFKLKSYIKKI